MKLFSWFSGTTFTKRAKIAAAVVTVLAFVASFSHIYQLAYEVGESRFTALLIPLIIDVSVLAGVYTGLAAAQENRSRGVWSWLALWVGGSATIAANLASSEDNVTAKLVSVTPPVFLIITIEVLAYLVNRVEAREPEPVKPITAAQFVRENPGISAEELVEAKGITPRHAQRLLARYGSASD